MSSKSLRTVTSYPAIVGQVLCELRKKRGIDQAALAKLVGVTQPTWSRIETGASALTIEQLAVAADKLGVTPSEILVMADKSVKQLQSKGVEIENRRVSGGIETGDVILGTASIGALINLLVKK